MPFKNMPGRVKIEYFLANPALEQFWDPKQMRVVELCA